MIISKAKAVLLVATLLGCAVTSHAKVYLSSAKCSPAQMPNIYTDDTGILSGAYRLRCKMIDGSQYGFHAATSFQNNNRPLDQLPPPGHYGSGLYYITYSDTTYTTVTAIGPQWDLDVDVYTDGYISAIPTAGQSSYSNGFGPGVTVSFSINDNGVVSSGSRTFAVYSAYEYATAANITSGPGYVVWTITDIASGLNSPVFQGYVTHYMARYIRQTRTWNVTSLKQYQVGSWGYGLAYASIGPQILNQQQYMWSAQVQAYDAYDTNPGSAWIEYGTYNIPTQQL